jgi:hypothetical protein
MRTSRGAALVLLGAAFLLFPAAGASAFAGIPAKTPMIGAASSSPRGGLRAFERLARQAVTSSYRASYNVIYPGGFLVTTTVARRGAELMWLTSSSTGLEEFLKTGWQSYLCTEPLHGGTWSCSVPPAASQAGLMDKSEATALYDSLPSVSLLAGETVRLASRYEAGRNLTCLYREWDHDVRYRSDWCLTSSGVFASAVLESAAAGPKYEVVTLTALSGVFPKGLFVLPPGKAKGGVG